MAKGREIDVRCQPVFVVGCGHSGTTLTASLIARHPDVLGIGDETEAFFSRNEDAYIRGAVRQWDTFTQQFGCSTFVEKTPRHVHQLERIFTALPKARIVLTAREPRDNVASLFERYKDLERAIIRYNGDNEAALKFLDDERVKLCRYEDTVTNPEAQLESIFGHCGLHPEPGLSKLPDELYRHWEQRGGNRAIRAAQLASPVTDRTGAWRARLTRKEARQVKAATAEIARRIGY